MKNLSIARRYARALMLISQEDGQTEIYREELARFAALLNEDKSLGQTVINPLYSAESRRKLLQTVLVKLGISNVMSSYFLLLFEKRRIGFLGYINDQFQKMADEAKGIARASVISAVELSEDTVDKIKTSLSKRINKEVILDVNIDPGIIGGIVTKIGDLVLDGSIKNQLLNMRESLKEGESA